MGRGKLPNLEFKNQFQQLAVLIYFSGNVQTGYFARTSIFFVCYDRGIFEYFAGQ